MRGWTFISSGFWSKRTTKNVFGANDSNVGVATAVLTNEDTLQDNGPPNTNVTCVWSASNSGVSVRSKFISSITFDSLSMYKVCLFMPNLQI